MAATFSDTYIYIYSRYELSVYSLCVIHRRRSFITGFAAFHTAATLLPGYIRELKADEKIYSIKLYAVRGFLHVSTTYVRTQWEKPTSYNGESSVHKFIARDEANALVCGQTTNYLTQFLCTSLNEARYFLSFFFFSYAQPQPYRVEIASSFSRVFLSFFSPFANFFFLFIRAIFNDVINNRHVGKLNLTLPAVYIGFFFCIVLIQTTLRRKWKGKKKKKKLSNAVKKASGLCSNFTNFKRPVHSADVCFKKLKPHESLCSEQLFLFNMVPFRLSLKKFLFYVPVSSNSWLIYLRDLIIRSFVVLYTKWRGGKEKSGNTERINDFSFLRNDCWEE